MRKQMGENLLLVIAVSSVNVALDNALINQDQHSSRLHVFF